MIRDRDSEQDKERCEWNTEERGEREWRVPGEKAAIDVGNEGKNWGEERGGLAEAET